MSQPTVSTKSVVTTRKEAKQEREKEGKRERVRERKRMNQN